MTIKDLKTPLLLMTLLAFSSSLYAFKDKNQDLTAHKAAGKFEELNLSNLPAWSKETSRKLFKEIRDKKFLEYKGEKRRIPWLYGRDGCHMRSTHFTNEVQRMGFEKPKKVFIFGSLEMRGTIIPYGSVKPWFHAAPIVQVEGEAMVLDPSVSFSRPLPIAEWARLIVSDKNKVIYSICDADAYLPTTSCLNPGPIDQERLDQETQLFLKFERNILRNLGLSFH